MMVEELVKGVRGEGRGKFDPSFFSFYFLALTQLNKGGFGVGLVRVLGLGSKLEGVGFISNKDLIG